MAMTIMDCVLRRWDKRTLDETVIPLCTTYVSCARCGRMAEFHLAERDDLTGEFVHAGNCPYIRPVVAPPQAPVPQQSRAQEEHERAAARQQALRVVARRATPVAKSDPTSVAAVERVVARHAATMRTPEQVRAIHADALLRARERAEAARRAAGGQR